MSITIGWAAIGVIIAIISHAIFTIFWAAKMTFHIENLNNSIIKVDKELEKRDIQISAGWKKLDSINQRLVVVETKVGSHLED